MPSLTYSFRIGEILLETTPWLTKSDEAGGTMMMRDEQNEAYREVQMMLDDDNGNAHYVLKCFSIDGRIQQSLSADGAITCSQLIFPFSLDVDRAP